MSYDYDSLVASIATHRSKAAHDDNDDDDADDNRTSHLQQAVDTFATLSSHCPMTPLLWMQYAYDTWRLMTIFLPNEPQQACEMRLRTLELGLAEFPGCALLWLHYLQLLMKEQQGKEGHAAAEADNKVETAFSRAIASVGRGSHRNEGYLVVAIYRLYVDFLASYGSQHDKVLSVFVDRARTPLKDVNDGLVTELQESFRQSDGSSTTMDVDLDNDDLQQIEDARRWTAKTFSSLATYEDDVDVAMDSEGISTRHEYSRENKDDVVDWETLLQSQNGRLWMGFGGTQTANAFIQYANACSYYRVPRHEFEQDQEEGKRKQDTIHSLAAAVYERGVAECPTVETLWLSYIRHLMYLITTKNPLASLSQLESVAERATRNCPYSLQLVQQKLKTLLISAEAGQVVFDPDSLTSIVENTIKSQFLPDPASQLELHMTAIRTVKRRIMSILAQAAGGSKYDDVAEHNGKKSKGTDDEAVASQLGEAAEQEIQDLVEDIRDMYEAVDAFLRKNHSSWSKGRTILWKDRAITETYLLGPLLNSLEVGDGPSGTSEGLRCFEKLVKLHQPPHPDSYAVYIREFMKQPASTPQQVIRNLKATRSLFQKSLKTVGKAKETSDEKPSYAERERNTALQSLCHDYLEFEQLFGSDESYMEASNAVRKKFETLVSNGNHQEDASGNTTLSEDKDESNRGKKRTRSENSSSEPHGKKSKKSVAMDNTETSDVSGAEKKGDATTASEIASVEKPKIRPVHKVHVGKLDYPAHPFTVRVTNLSSETEDMDLVDLFRPKCGAVVHAKVVREKHHGQGKGRSKGWGLVQFEERDSVEKALALNDVVGIHEHIVKIDRSHVPAVGLVPPGMHRVNPRGEGKSSKRNQKRRERKMSKDDTIRGNDMKSGAEDTKGTEARESDAQMGDASKPKEPSDAGILAFRPRGVVRAHRHGDAHRKVKVSLNEKESKG